MVALALEDGTDLPPPVRDSKQLSPEQREQLYSELEKLPHATRIIEPEEIDQWVAQGKLNWLEAEHTAALLRELEAERAVIDCPSRNKEAYKAFLQERLPGCELTVEHKADENHPVVSAASIIAKVVRDRLVAAIREEVGVDFGSGYLTDPKTQEFLEDFDPDFPHFRKSWKTYQRLLAEHEQETLF